MPPPIIGNKNSKTKAEDNSSESNGKGQFINTLALIIVLLSAAILIILIFMAKNHLAKDDTSFDNIKDLIGILLPVIGTWMGTILAFYFSKQNFEAANQRVKEMVNQITDTDGKLQVLKVSDVMMKPENFALLIVKDEAEFKAQKLSDLVKKMDETHSERMPILQANTLKFIFFNLQNNC